MVLIRSTDGVAEPTVFVFSNSCVPSVREFSDIPPYVTCASFHELRPEFLAEEVE